MFHWFCAGCNKAAGKLLATVANVTKRALKLKLDVDMLKKEVEKLNTMDHKLDSNIMLVENIEQKLHEGDKLIEISGLQINRTKIGNGRSYEERIQPHNVRSSGIYER